jgi:hypothetical protein
MFVCLLPLSCLGVNRSRASNAGGLDDGGSSSLEDMWKGEVHDGDSRYIHTDDVFRCHRYASLLLTVCVPDVDCFHSVRDGDVWAISHTPSVFVSPLPFHPFASSALQSHPLPRSLFLVNHSTVSIMATAASSTSAACWRRR